MTRVRISTTVDADLLRDARACCAGEKDASVMERALRALLAEHRAAEFDRRIDVAYREAALDEPDEWGDLGSFLSAANQEPGASAAR
jgi:hypothetical protein